MSGERKSLIARTVERIFPKSPDFFAMLAEQSLQAAHTAGMLVVFMETDDHELNAEIKKDEHVADTIKVRNIHALNEAFSTPIDREDIYRAIMDLDDIVTYCKTAVKEMIMLGVTPDNYTLELAQLLKEGADAVATGFGKLAVNPQLAAVDADTARHAERHVEKLYRQALADLFQGDDYINMFKRREIYRHLSNAADRMAHSANTLHDIVVKMC
ncbi:MAG TPA: DUF47 family protein [Gallionella sp.]|nr:DUF47 family protein [Gallionella sp.]